MPVLTKINTNSIADDAITAEKYSLEASGYVANTTNQNISGTYSDNRMYTSDAYTLSANATVNGHLTLSTVKPTGDVVLTASGAYTITGTGVLSGGSLAAPQRSVLTGMTGELGSAVTGSPNLNLSNVTERSTTTSSARDTNWHNNWPVNFSTPVYHQFQELDALVGSYTHNTSWLQDWIRLTIPANVCTGLTRVVIRTCGSVRVDKNTHSFADFGIVRHLANGTVSHRFPYHQVGSAGGTSSNENYHSISMMVIDDLSTVTEQRTYQIHARRAEGNTAYAGNVHYKYKGWTMEAVGYI